MRKMRPIPPPDFVATMRFDMFLLVQTLVTTRLLHFRLLQVGVIIIPRKSIMGKVDQIAFTTLVILISLSMCILAIGCVCIFILTSGVSKAMKLRAELISHLDARRRAEASSNYKSQFLANMR